VGQGKSKKKAEQSAAQLAVAKAEKAGIGRVHQPR